MKIRLEIEFCFPVLANHEAGLVDVESQCRGQNGESNQTETISSDKRTALDEQKTDSIDKEYASKYADNDHKDKKNISNENETNPKERHNDSTSTKPAS